MTTRCPPKAEATGSNPVGCTSFPRENVHLASPHPCRTLQEHARTDRDSAYNDRTAENLVSRLPGGEHVHRTAWKLTGSKKPFAEWAASRFQRRPAPVVELKPQPVAYFIGSELGPIKIGCALDPVTRLASVQTGNPIKLAILATSSGGYGRERAYHRQFAAHRLHGEWFARCPEIEAEIARLKAEAEV